MCFFFPVTDVKYVFANKCLYMKRYMMPTSTQQPATTTTTGDLKKHMCGHSSRRNHGPAHPPLMIKPAPSHKCSLTSPATHHTTPDCWVDVTISCIVRIQVVAYICGCPRACIMCGMCKYVQVKIMSVKGCRYIEYVQVIIKYVRVCRYMCEV